MTVSIDVSYPRLVHLKDSSCVLKVICGNWMKTQPGVAFQLKLETFWNTKITCTQNNFLWLQFLCPYCRWFRKNQGKLSPKWPARRSLWQAIRTHLTGTEALLAPSSIWSSPSLLWAPSSSLRGPLRWLWGPLWSPPISLVRERETLTMYRFCDC